MKFLKWIVISFVGTLIVGLGGFFAWRNSTEISQSIQPSTSVTAEIAPQSTIQVNFEEDPYKRSAAQPAIAKMNKWLVAHQTDWKTICDEPITEIEFSNPNVLTVKVAITSVKLVFPDHIYCQTLKDDELELVESLRAPLEEGRKLGEKEEKTPEEKEAEQKRNANLPSCNIKRIEKIAFVN